MNPSKQIIFKSTINFIILFCLSGFSLANEDVTATFSANPITGKLTNGQVLGKVTFNYVRVEENADFNFTGFYNMTGSIVTSNPAGYALCTTNVPGIGVQYYLPTGSMVKCATTLNWFYIFNRNKNPRGSLLQINADIIKFVVYDASKLQQGGQFSITILSTTWFNNVINYRAAVNISPNITFNIPSQKNPAIYFPDYPAGNPTFNLPFRIGSNGPQNLYATAEKRIQMCLTDDNGINSSQFMLLFTSQFQSNANNSFYLQRQGGSATDSDQINYQLSILNPKTQVSQQVIASQPVIWSYINTSTVNTVNYTINGKNQPCVLTPLTIKVPRFDYSSKTSGTYSGNIKILFTPTMTN